MRALELGARRASESENALHVAERDDGQRHADEGPEAGEHRLYDLVFGRGDNYSASRKEKPVQLRIGLEEVGAKKLPKLSIRRPAGVTRAIACQRDSTSGSASVERSPALDSQGRLFLHNTSSSRATRPIHYLGCVYFV